MKIGKDHVIVRLLNPMVDRKGHIIMRTDIDKDQHYINKAEVVTTPIGMSKNMRILIPKYVPLEPNGPQDPQYEISDDEDPDEAEFKIMGAIKAVYSEECVKFHNYADIAMEVEIGDMVYFNWTALSKEQNFVRFEGEYQLWKIDYPNIFCALRNEQIIMIGSWVLIEPEWESFDDILVPVYYPLELTGGKKKLKPKSQWIQTKTEPEADELKGFVRHVGTPLKGQECYVKSGDHIFFMKGSKLNVEVEGKKYYVMRQHRIEAKIEGVSRPETLKV